MPNKVAAHRRNQSSQLEQLKCSNSFKSEMSMLDNVLGRNSGLDNSQFMHLLTPARSVTSNNANTVDVAATAVQEEEEDQKKTARFSQVLNQVLSAAEIAKKLGQLEVKPYTAGGLEECKADDVPI